MPYTDFHYTPTGTGVISGKEVLEQTEDAINDLGGQISGDVQTAIDTANNALNTANTASADAQNAVNTANTAYTAATTAQNTANAAQNTASNALTAAQNAQNDVNALGNRVTTAENNITQNTTDISGLTTRMGTAEGNITTLQNDVVTAQGTATSAQNTATMARQQAYVLRYSSTAITDNSTIAYSTLDNTDNIKATDKIIDVDGKIFSIVSVDSDNSTVTVGSALTDLALDANVMHLSGNETAGGFKTFDRYIQCNGGYIGTEASTNDRTELILRSNRDTAGQSGILVTKFRQNRSQGELQPLDLQKIGFDVLENQVRTNNVLDIQVTGWSDNIPTQVKIVSSITNNSFGSTSNPCYINNLNPGALGMPDLSNGIDISGYITVVANANKESLYTPPANGWISVALTRAGGTNMAVMLKQGNFTSSGHNIAQENGTTTCNAMLPVKGGVQVSINSALADGIAFAYFYPCLGNV